MNDNVKLPTAEQVEELLARYYDAQATEAEERLLREYFTRAEVPERLQGERRFFRALAAAEEGDVPGELPASPRLVRRRRIWLAAASVAAACLALVYFLPAFRTGGPQPQEAALQDTYDDPQRAAAEAERALAKFSICINRGLAQAALKHHSDEAD